MATSVSNSDLNVSSLKYVSSSPKRAFFKSQDKKLLFVRMIEYRQKVLKLTVDRMMIWIDDLHEFFHDGSFYDLKSVIDRFRRDSLKLEKSTSNLQARIVTLKELTKKVQALDYRVSRLHRLMSSEFEHSLSLIMEKQKHLEERDRVLLDKCLDSISVSYDATNYQRRCHGNQTPLMFAVELNDPLLFEKLVKKYGCRFDSATLHYIVDNVFKYPKIASKLKDFMSDPECHSSILFTMQDCLNAYEKATVNDNVNLVEQLLIGLDKLVLSLGSVSESDHFHNNLSLKWRALLHSEKGSMLRIAVLNKAIKVVGYLVGHYCDASTFFFPSQIRGFQGKLIYSYEPVETAFSMAVRLGSYEMVKHFLMAVPNDLAIALVNYPSIQIFVENYSKEIGNTFRYVAKFPLQSTSNHDIQRLLLDTGANSEILSPTEQDDLSHRNSSTFMYELHHEKLFQDCDELDGLGDLSDYLDENYESIHQQEMRNPIFLHMALLNENLHLVAMLLTKKISSCIVPYIYPSGIVEPPLVVALKTAKLAFIKMLLVESELAGCTSLMVNFPYLIPDVNSVRSGVVRFQTPLQVAHSFCVEAIDKLKAAGANTFLDSLDNNPVDMHLASS